jgi:hypothetical protein
MARSALPVAVLACLLPANLACAGQRSEDLVHSFEAFCMPGPPEFAAIDAKATDLKLPVRKDVLLPRHDGQFARSKSWLVSLDSGAHELVASEAQGPNSKVAACGIGAENADGEDMKQELTKTMKLGAPARQTASADGTQRLTSWKYADDVTLLLADGTPMKIPGMYLTLIQQTTNR